MQLYEIESYNTDPSLRAVRPPQRTFVRARDMEMALAFVCNALAIEEPGMVQVSLFTGIRPIDAVVLN